MPSRSMHPVSRWWARETRALFTGWTVTSLDQAVGHASDTSDSLLAAAKRVGLHDDGNVGDLYTLGPGIETSGTLTSEVLDAHEFTYWGKAHVTSELHGGTVTLETRSGNLNNPRMAGVGGCRRH